MLHWGKRNSLSKDAIPAHPLSSRGEMWQRRQSTGDKQTGSGSWSAPRDDALLWTT